MDVQIESQQFFFFFTENFVEIAVMPQSIVRASPSLKSKSINRVK